jgi:hypothetical protein
MQRQIFKFICVFCYSTFFAVSSAIATELVHSFNSPAFSGQGYSSHILTIKQLEDQAKEKNKSIEDAIKSKAESAAANTPQARFIANLESRIYSQLAKQLTDSMFGEGATCTTAGVVCGSIPNLGGNAINWSLGAGSDQGMIIITIQDLSNVSNVTTMKVPAGTFYF